MSEHALFPNNRGRHRIYRGLVTERQEHIFTWVAVVVVLLYATAWVGATALSQESRLGRPFEFTEGNLKT